MVHTVTYIPDLVGPLTEENRTGCADVHTLIFSSFRIWATFLFSARSSNQQGRISQADTARATGGRLWQRLRICRVSNRLCTVLRIAPTRIVKAAKIYEKCRRQFACINPFQSGNRPELLCEWRRLDSKNGQLTSYSVSFNVLPFQAKRIMKRSAQSRKPFDKIRAGSVLMSEQSPIMLAVVVSHQFAKSANKR